MCHCPEANPRDGKAGQYPEPEDLPTVARPLDPAPAGSAALAHHAPGDRDLPNQPARGAGSGAAPRDLERPRECAMPAPLLIVLTALLAPDPWADAVVSFQPGTGGAPGYDDPTTALGPPESMTGEDTDTTSVVSPFSPAWRPDEIISLGAGGSIVLAFDQPVENDPTNPWGIDLIVYGNAGFIDTTWPDGTCGGLFGSDGGEIAVSGDGASWHVIPDALADDLWPTLAWQDAGPYDEVPGAVATDPTRAIDPSLSLADVEGDSYEDLVDRYAGAAGGVGIDLASVGLEAVTHVRVSVAVDAWLSAELDAVVDAGPWTSGDLTGDGLVGVDDLLIVIADWGQAGGAADLDGDGEVGVNDLLIVLEAWT